MRLAGMSEIDPTTTILDPGGPRPETETWDLSPIYASEEAFRDEQDRFRESLEAIDSYRGRLGDGAKACLEALEAIWERKRVLSRLHAWAHMRSDEDTRVPSRQRLRQEIELVGTEFGRCISWLRPELLSLPEGRIDAYLVDEPGLAPFGHFLRDLVRQRPHVLDPAEERIVAEAALLLGGPPHVFGVFHNAEMPRPEIEVPGGEPATLTPSEFGRLRVSTDRLFRERLFPSFFRAYTPFRETLAANLFDCLKSHVFHARVRRYGSTLEAALAPDNVPESVYRNLIARVRENLPLLHRYFRIRARALGLEDLGYHDLHCPILAGPGRKYSAADASRLVLESMGVLSQEYVSELRRAFADRWFDWHPAPGKRSGAYASGAAYDVHPYVLLNFNGDYDAVSTLAHEAGHAMHSHYSNRRQPYASSDYSIFVAEVASTFNEALLNEHLLRRATDDAERGFLLANWLDGLRATLFRQTFFAEFELSIHEAAERGEAPTGEWLCSRYLDLLRDYQGHYTGHCRVDDVYGIEWACVPHFYYNFYVYQYATGIVAANSLADDVLKERPRASERYLAFLGSGGSDDPLPLLREAGVDLESKVPYTKTFETMDERLSDLEKILGLSPPDQTPTEIR
jgi:oligoendopeptidase F